MRSDSDTTLSADRPRLAGPLTCYLVTTVLFTGALLLLQGQAGINPSLIFIGQFGPALGALLTMAVFRRASPSFAPPRIDRHTFVVHGVWAIVAVALFAGGMWLFATLLGRPAVEPVPGALVLFLILQLAGALGEEAGWRGFLQPMFETRMGRLAASLVTGAIWALWHTQHLATPGFFVWFFLSCLALSLLFGFIADGNRWQRTLIAGFMHWMVNVSLFFLMSLGPDSSAWPFALVPALIVALLYGVRRIRRG